MNTTILWRLAWKEFRLLRDFWVAVFALGCVCLLIMAWRMKTTDDPASLFFVAMGVTACYALGCGAIAFAGEREARTDDFQRVLPVTAANCCGQAAACAGQHAGPGRGALGRGVAGRHWLGEEVAPIASAAIEGA